MSFFVILIIAISGVNSQSNISLNNVCPKQFLPIGQKCYYFSKDEQTWDDAFYNCQDINSTLAVVTRSHQELLIRRYLNRKYRGLGRFERWIGGKFDWEQSKWVWAETAKPMTFQAFSRMKPNLKSNWQWNCVILDPARQNKWGAKNCLEKKHYVCQTHAKRKMNLKGKAAKMKPEEIRRRNSPAVLIQNSTRKIYEDYICPSHMILIVKKCYYFSSEAATWNDAHYACQENNTKLAAIKSKIRDNILRGFLNRNFVGKHERWIGGMYDWQQNKWLWAMKGEPIIYKNFARMALHNKDLTWNCITLDPNLQYRWNTQNRSELKHYICQTKAKTLIKYQNQKKTQSNAAIIIQFDPRRKRWGDSGLNKTSDDNKKTSSDLIA